jgi:hypothetical protein
MSEAAAYHSFPLIDGSEKEGFKFGRITIPTESSTWGDAYVVAPDGSRAGIVWHVDGHASPQVVIPPEPGRWGVYSFGFAEPARSLEDLVTKLHGVLPEIKAYYAAALATCPASTNGGCGPGAGNDS